MGYQILCTALQLYFFILLARIVLSWVQMFGASTPPALGPVIKLIYDLTEPVMGLLRRYIPPIGGFDLSPIFIFVALSIIRGYLGC